MYTVVTIINNNVSYVTYIKLKNNKIGSQRSDVSVIGRWISFLGLPYQDIPDGGPRLRKITVSSLGSWKVLAGLARAEASLLGL